MSPVFNDVAVANGLNVLNEFAHAIRGDWGSIDGRVIQANLQWLIVEMQADTPAEIARIRDNINICVAGGGHWQMYCDEECEPRDP